jgi:hypothetical protein
MAVVVIAAAASYAGSAAAAYAVSAFAVSAFTAAVITAGVASVVGGVLGGAIGGRGSNSNSSAGFTARAEGRDQVVRSAAANRTIVYGRAMVSGPLVFASISGESNGTLFLVIPLAGHEIDAVETVYLNDLALPNLGDVASGPYAGAVRVSVHRGNPGDAADADLVAANVGWTAAHRLSGVAYLVLRMQWSQDVFPTGIPNVKAIVRGKKLFDPRTGLTAWSQNPALAVRDYITAAAGLQADASEVDTPLLIAAANVCDELVNTLEGTEPRYTCNGVLDLGDAPRGIMEGMLSAMHGHVVWSAGTYRLHAGAYSAPAVTLTASDLAGPVRVRPRITRRDLFNAVRGTFVDPAQFWKPTDYPGQSNSTYAAQDSGVIWRDMALPYTTSSATAQRIAKLTLERSRQGITVETTLKLSAMRLATLDTVMLTFPQLGWAAKEFKLLEWKFSAEGGIDVVLQEETAASYAWNSGNQTVVDPAPDTNLPNPFDVGMPGVPAVVEALYRTTGSAGVKARAVVSWAAAPDVFVLAYLPEYKLATDAAWELLPRTAGTSIDIDDLAPGIYEFRLRAENSIGVRGAYTATTTQELAGLTAPPANIINFSVHKSAGFALASWTLHPDLDVRIGGRIQIRHTQLKTAAVWTDGVVLDDFNGDANNALVPLLEGTYMAKAVDSTGNYSAGIASFVATQGLITGFSTVATSIQHPDFTGVKTNVTLVSGGIQLDGTTPIDSADAIDSLGDIDGLGGILATGSYAFNAVMDLGSVATRRILSTLRASSFVAVDLIDSRLSLCDYWGPMDGDVVNDCDATLLASTTDDDPAGTPVWGPYTPFFVGDFSCRALRFRLDLVSGSSQNNISISQLRVDALVPV